MPNVKTAIPYRGTPEQEAKLREELSGVYEQLAEKPAAYQLHWNKNRRVVEEALGDVFQIPLAGLTIL